jgi:hypothetical protein
MASADSGVNSSDHIQELTMRFSESPVQTRSATQILAEDKPPPVRREHAIDPRGFPSVIPPDHNNRTLVVCFDGTGDQFDADNSNIVQLVQLLKKDDNTKQLVYYQVCGIILVFVAHFRLITGVNVIILVGDWNLYITADRFAVRVAGTKSESYSRVSFCSLD